MQDVSITAESQSSVGWICTNALLFAVAKSILDEEYEDTSARLGNNLACSGRIGSVNVEIVLLDLPINSGNVTSAVQSLVTSHVAVKCIIVTAFAAGPISHDIKVGDVFISQLNTRDEEALESASIRKWSLSQQAVMLQREVGGNGRWLSSNSATATSHTHLHYGSLSLANLKDPITELWDKKLPQDPQLQDIACELKSFPIDVVAVLGISKYADSSIRSEEIAASNAASYAKELILGLTLSDLQNSIEILQRTETIVPPRTSPTVPPFKTCHFPRHGDAILLVIPTANDAKRRLLQDYFERIKREDTTLHSIIVPSSSGVGEQPYNEAGVLGAYNRINNALLQLHSPSYLSTMISKKIGIVIVASIESYIQLPTDSIDRPTDFGVVVVHNASTGKTTVGLSWGVTVPRAYVERARRFGVDRDVNFGRVTVGQIMAAHVPGLDKADWQVVLAGQSRYDLLSEVIRQLETPW